VAIPNWDEFGFKDYILLESRVYLGGKMGDILTALQELRDDAKSMGTRSLVRYSEKIVNQIRRVLHTHWPKDDMKFLRPLQKIGVAMMKAIEEREGLEEIVAGSADELEKVIGKMGVPINKIGANTSEDPDPDEDKSTSPKEQNSPTGGNKKQEQPPADDQQQQQPPAEQPQEDNPLDPNAGATPGAAMGQSPPPAPVGM
jgi:hypothetical protein